MLKWRGMITRPGVRAFGLSSPPRTAFGPALTRPAFGPAPWLRPLHTSRATRDEEELTPQQIKARFLAQRKARADQAAKEAEEAAAAAAKQEELEFQMEDQRALERAQHQAEVSGLNPISSLIRDKWMRADEIKDGAKEACKEKLNLLKEKILPDPSDAESSELSESDIDFDDRFANGFTTDMFMLQWLRENPEDGIMDFENLEHLVTAHLEPKVAQQKRKEAPGAKVDKDGNVVIEESDEEFEFKYESLEEGIELSEERALVEVESGDSRPSFWEILEGFKESVTTTDRFQRLRRTVVEAEGPAAHAADAIRLFWYNYHRARVLLYDNSLRKMVRNFSFQEGGFSPERDFLKLVPNFSKFDTFRYLKKFWLPLFFRSLRQPHVKLLSELVDGPAVSLIIMKLRRRFHRRKFRKNEFIKIHGLDILSYKQDSPTEDPYLQMMFRAEFYSQPNTGHHDSFRSHKARVGGIFVIHLKPRFDHRFFKWTCTLFHGRVSRKYW